MSRFKPSPALVVGVVALVVAMTGSAVAAGLITSRQIKNGTIQVKDINKGARATLKGNRGLQGLPGARGLNGANGAAGATGPAGVVGLHYVVGTPVTTTVIDQYEADATCPATESVVSGGVVSSSSTREVMQVNTSASFDSPTTDADTIPDDGWFVDVDVNDAAGHTITAFAICTTAGAISKTGAAITAKR